MQLLLGNGNLPQNHSQESFYCSVFFSLDYVSYRKPLAQTVTVITSKVFRRFFKKGGKD